jgi:hypothetical protein
LKHLSADQAGVLESWKPLVSEAVQMVVLNRTAGLSAADTMAFWPCLCAMMVVESATKHSAQRAKLLRTEVVDALEYACVHDFCYLGVSIGTYAAGAVTELVGRNEEGKTLSRETVFAVLSRVECWFDETSAISKFTPEKTSIDLSRVATMAVSDTNKRLMLEFEAVVELLVKFLLVGSGRRGEKGGDVLQEQELHQQLHHRLELQHQPFVRVRHRHRRHTRQID